MKCFSFKVRVKLSPAKLKAIREEVCNISWDGFLQTRRRSLVFLNALDTDLLKGCVLLHPVVYQDAETQVQAFLASLGISQRVDEMTGLPKDAAMTAIFKAFRAGWLKETDAVLDAFGMLRLQGVHGEISTLNANDGMNVLRMKAKQFPQVPELSEELERIFVPDAHAACMGHPVHYVLEMTERQGHRKAVDVLLSSLYLQRRIQRRRYQTLRISPVKNMEQSLIQDAIEASLGGALVLDFVPDCPEECFVNYANHSHIMDICNHAFKYARQVLFVFCFAAYRGSNKEFLEEMLPNTPLLVIGQKRLDEEGAREYLQSLADAEGAEADEALFKALETDNEGFHETDLQAQYEAWYQGYLCRVVNPQYNHLKCSDRPSGKKEQAVVPACAEQKAYDILQTMVGLSGAKNVIDRVLSAHRARKLYQQCGIEGDAPPMHMVFTGNPGTAKTSVARLCAKIFKEEGILKRGKLIEVSRAELVGKYVGWTARLVKEQVRKAKGSVLFIDEAYSLLNGRECQFGEEAVNTLVMEMENCRKDTVIILAGYPEQMENLLQFNPGLRSRIGFHISFEDYSPEEMLQILRLMAKEQGFYLDESVEQSMLPWLERAARVKEAGNGRLVRNLLDQARMKQAERILRLAPEELSDDCVRTLLPQDFEEPYIHGHAQTFIGFQ